MSEPPHGRLHQSLSSVLTSCAIGRNRLPGFPRREACSAPCLIRFHVSHLQAKHCTLLIRHLFLSSNRRQQPLFQGEVSHSELCTKTVSLRLKRTPQG